MASSQEKVSEGWLMFQLHKPHFFTVILDDPVLHGKLGIPKRFARKYGSELSTPAILKVPSGAKWKVELMKSDGDIWLGEGWPEFAKYYSVIKCSFLVFEYQGESNFHVAIFDTSATEIDYPLSTNNNNDHKEMSHFERHFQDQRVIKVEDGDNGHIQNLNNHFNPTKRPLPGATPSKKMRTRSTSIMESSLMQTSVKRNGRITIKEHCFGGKSEARGYNTSTFPKTRGSPLVRVRKTPLTVSERDGLLRRASDSFVSSNPYFMVALQRTYTYSYLQMPRTFAKKYNGMQRDTTILHVGDGRTWPVKLQFAERRGHAVARIYEGWRKFVLDNQLEVGDVCVFEVVRCTQFSMKVVIFRFKDSMCNKSLGNTKQVKQELSSGDEFILKQLGSRTLEAAGGGIKFSSTNPFFKIEMESRHFASSCCMIVPPKTFLQCIKVKIRDVILKVADKEWSVRLLRRSVNSALLSAGWKRFAKENSLEVGDICVFELLERATMLIKVSIFKHGG